VSATPPGGTPAVPPPTSLYSTPGERWPRATPEQPCSAGSSPAGTASEAGTKCCCLIAALTFSRSAIVSGNGAGSSHGHHPLSAIMAGPWPVGRIQRHRMPALADVVTPRLPVVVLFAQAITDDQLCAYWLISRTTLELHGHQ
jgi:hypothetical protein